MEKYNQSVIDTLLQLMPNLRNRMIKNKNYINPVSARNLYSIWRTGDNKISDRVYKRPRTVSLSQVEEMQKEGLVRPIGNKIEITDKGSEVLRVMILGNDKSSFDKDEDIIIDYNQALSNIKNVKTAKGGLQKAASSWWGRFVKKDE